MRNKTKSEKVLLVYISVEIKRGKLNAIDVEARKRTSVVKIVEYFMFPSDGREKNCEFRFRSYIFIFRFIHSM